jgi:mevalonate kinase
MTVTISAPGKIHLLGEHMVVYGKPALLAAIDKRLYINIKNQSARQAQDKNSKIKNKEKIIIISPEKDSLVRKIIEVFKNSYSINKLPPLEITITSQIPVGCGLGSSAALSSSLIGALMKFVKNIWNPVQINELSYEVEKFAHGHPSGADNTTVVFGGMVWFRREFDFLKSIWSLPPQNYHIPKFFLINSGKPLESTKEMVTQVNRLYNRNKKKIEEVFNDQEKETKRLLVSLKEGNSGDLVSSIRQGERNLEKIEIVSSFAQKIIREIEEKGGAAKVCGAGGKKGRSGILLCFHPSFSILQKIAQKYETPIMPVQLGGEGIKIEQ